MAFRTATALRPLALSASLAASAPSASRSLTARALTTATATATGGRPLASALARAQSGPATPRFLSTTPRVRLEASAPLGDGGNTEPPEHGINVDKSMRMDACVGFYFFLLLFPSV